MIVEVGDGQTALDAYQQNLPVYNIANLKNPLHIYPPSSKSMDTGRLYAWRIIAKNNYENVGQSDIWTFTIREKKNKTEAIDPSTASYAKLTRDVQSGIVHCKDVIRFQYHNDIGDSSKAYKIIDLSSNQSQPMISGKIETRYGLNHLNLPLQKKKGFNNHDTYMLTILNSRKEEWVLKFIGDSK